MFAYAISIIIIIIISSSSSSSKFPIGEEFSYMPVMAE